MTTGLLHPATLENAKLAAPVQAATLETLAARFRPGGACLLLLQADKTISYSDAAAPQFFQRYVLSMFAHPDATVESIFSQMAALTPDSAIAVWNNLPGVVLVAVPCVDRRSCFGVLLLAAKSPSFKLGDDVVRTCAQLGLDPLWLNQQAEQMPAIDDDSMQRRGRMLLSMLRDQTRLASLEDELNVLSGKLSDTFEEMTLIHQLSSGMKVNLGTADFFRQACQDMLAVTNVRGMGVILTTRPPTLYGQARLPAGVLQRLGDELMAQLSERKSPLVIPSLSADANFSWFSEHARQLLAAPLIRQDQVLGCIFSLDKNNGEFDSIDSEFLNSIAIQCAIYLENATLFEDTRGLMMGLIHSLTSAVDAKDAYTCGHSERVAQIARLLARGAGVSEQQVERIYMAALLHDVGKIGVPEAVLQKTGRLNTEEFEQMKKHPAIGARILKDIRQVEDIIPGVLHHHERFDGKGYPAGLSGENIPLMGRIICLADCFDAMTSNRTYRKAMPPEMAMIEIRRCAGTQFDPRLTDIFLSLGVEQFRQILSSDTAARRAA